MNADRSSSRPNARTAHERVRFAAFAFLVVGLAAALLVFVLAPDDEAADINGIAGGKLYQHNLGVIGGRAAINAARFDDWFESLWHGRSLALVIALATLAITGGCLWIAHLMSIPPLPLHPPGRQAADDALLKERDQDGDGHDGDDQRGRDDVPGKRELPLVEGDADRQRAHPHRRVE